MRNSKLRRITTLVVVVQAALVLAAGAQAADSGKDKLSSTVTSLFGPHRGG
jgi:hypothetical protein